jgi:hypothetical protein
VKTPARLPPALDAVAARSTAVTVATAAVEVTAEAVATVDQAAEAADAVVVAAEAESPTHKALSEAHSFHPLHGKEVMFFVARECSISLALSRADALRFFWFY